jgi:hypothetical protein
LRKEGYKNVGILPFQVCKGKEQKATFDTTLSVNLPTRLENALILLDKPDKQIGILHDAGQIALSHDRKANYLSASGRRALFGQQYPLAWGDKKETPDVFLAGEVTMSSDNKQGTVIIKAFDRKASEPRTVSRFTVKTDRSILGDSGQSFRLTSRQIRKRDADLDAAAVTDATSQEAKTADSQGPNTGLHTGPTTGPDTSLNTGPSTGTDTAAPGPGDNPIKLTVLYDGQPQTIDNDPNHPGERRVRPRAIHRGPRSGSPTPGSIATPSGVKTIELVIENTSPSDTLGVVLKVNGQNTLFQETEDAANCHKWILDPGKKYSIRGYYSDDAGNNLLPFKVLSDDDSKQKEGEFKDNDKLGLIEIHAFRSNAVDKMDISRKVSLRGLSPHELQKSRPRSLPELQTRLEKRTYLKGQSRGLAIDTVAITKKASTRPVRQKNDRGLIVGDDTKLAGGNLTRKDFDNPEEVSNQVIQYYVRQGTAVASVGDSPK